MKQYVLSGRAGNIQCPIIQDWQTTHNGLLKGSVLSFKRLVQVMPKPLVSKSHL